MIWRHYLPAILCAGVIFVASGLPASYLPEYRSFKDWFGPDKIVHLALFGIFQYYLFVGLYKSRRPGEVNVWIIGFYLLIGIIFGILTEVLQLYVFTGRSANIYDATADAIGCFSGLGFFFLILKKNTKTR